MDARWVEAEAWNGVVVPTGGRRTNGKLAFYSFKHSFNLKLPDTGSAQFILLC